MAIRFANDDWARVHLCTSVGKVLRRRGRLFSLGSPNHHRGSNLPLTTYADIVRRSLMEGGGAGRGSAGGFGGAMPGTGRGLGDEANQGRPQVAPQMMFGRGAGPSGINFGGAPPQQVFGAPQFGVPAAQANHQFGVPQGQFAGQGSSSHHMHQQQPFFHQQQHGSVVDHHQAMVEERHGRDNGATSGSAKKGLYPTEEMDGSHKVLERVLVRLQRFQVQIWEQTQMFLRQGH